jgi:hypothetical protein
MENKKLKPKIKVPKPRGRPKGVKGEKNLNTGQIGKRTIKPPIETINQMLISNYGIITTSAIKLGITPRTLYKWIDESTTLQETIKESRTRVLDFAESQLMKNISDGKEASLLFFLKCLGKSRGYVEREYPDNQLNITAGHIQINYIVPTDVPQQLPQQPIINIEAPKNNDNE